MSLRESLLELELELELVLKLVGAAGLGSRPERKVLAMDSDVSTRRFFVGGFPAMMVVFIAMGGCWCY